MRSVFHEILARYLAADQYAFETSPRELWPETRPSWHPQAGGSPGGGRSGKPGGGRGVYGELEPQN
jgi:hypothetical protein